MYKYTINGYYLKNDIIENMDSKQENGTEIIDNKVNYCVNNKCVNMKQFKKLIHQLNNKNSNESDSCIKKNNIELLKKEIPEYYHYLIDATKNGDIDYLNILNELSHPLTKDDLNKLLKYISKYNKNITIEYKEYSSHNKYIGIQNIRFDDEPNKINKKDLIKDINMLLENNAEMINTENSTKIIVNMDNLTLLKKGTEIEFKIYKINNMNLSTNKLIIKFDINIPKLKFDDLNDMTCKYHQTLDDICDYDNMLHIIRDNIENAIIYPYKSESNYTSTRSEQGQQITVFNIDLNKFLNPGQQLNMTEHKFKFINSILKPRYDTTFGQEMAPEGSIVVETLVKDYTTDVRNHFNENKEQYINLIKTVKSDVIGDENIQVFHYYNDNYRSIQNNDIVDALCFVINNKDIVIFSHIK